jgi:hypothetical protein
MDPRDAATRVPDPDAVEFIRFCYRRRRVGWPELYDEMCAVAGRGLFRGYSADDLAGHGIGFGLVEMPALATLARRIVEEEKARRRPMTVVLAETAVIADATATAVGAVVAAGEPMVEPEVVPLPVMPEPIPVAVVPEPTPAPRGRFQMVAPVPA